MNYNIVEENVLKDTIKKFNKYVVLDESLSFEERMDLLLIGGVNYVWEGINNL